MVKLSRTSEMENLQKKSMKNGKAAGTHSITVELLKADIETSVAFLEDLFNSIRDNEARLTNGVEG